MSRSARHLDTDKKTLDEFPGSGIQQVRVLLRALAIRHLGDGRLQRALYDKRRPGKKQLLDTPTRQRLTKPAPLCVRQSKDRRKRKLCI